MRLRIFDGVIFEISRVLESLFDVIEYHSAMQAEAVRQRQKQRAETGGESILAFKLQSAESNHD
jgi:hypothetical protein